MNLNFERYKLSRFIQMYGRPYTFSLSGKNQFGEPQGIEEEVVVSGVYHEASGNVYVSGSATDGANIKTKPFSMIMCFMKDALSLKTGMEVDIWNKTYKVIDLRDVSNLGVACDISLEVILGE